MDRAGVVRTLFSAPRALIGVVHVGALPGTPEDLTVPAGSFKAWKVEVTSAEGEPGATTLWIATDSRKVVKTSTSLPAMGGAVVTSELQP